jgi:predicted nuclease of predicted toxin-antitoxin system
MKFKIDENLPVEIAELLIKNGYNAKTVNEQQMKGTKDSVLINLCRQESARGGLECLIIFCHFWSRFYW